MISSIVIYIYLGDYSGQMAQQSLELNAQHLANQLETEEGAKTVLNKMRLLAEAKPESAEAWFWYGRIAAGTDHREEAEKAFKNAYHLEPSLIVGLQYANAMISVRGLEDKDLHNLLSKLTQKFAKERHLQFLQAEIAAARNKKKDFDYWYNLLRTQQLSKEQRQSLIQLKNRFVSS